MEQPIENSPVTTLYDLKGISAVDACFVRKWQVEWLQSYPHASPAEIAQATNTAILAGDIKLGVQR